MFLDAFIIGITLAICYIYYIDFAADVSLNRIKTKRDLVRGFIPLYNWFVKLKEKYNKLED